MPGDAVFLDVRSSLTDSRWEAVSSAFGDDELDRRAAAIAQNFPDMPLPVTRILAGRDLGELSVEQFLEPKLRDLLPNPSRFMDMDRAAARLADAVQEGTPVGVFGDYDVDGAAAAALRVNILGGLGIGVDVHIPPRL
ncbi:MAG: hypothetical protein VXX06_03370 [Pseudomonadota bacterium]|nr:hypothetical protein [Pseudomonadota bacterium]